MPMPKEPLSMRAMKFVAEVQLNVKNVAVLMAIDWVEDSLVLVMDKWYVTEHGNELELLFLWSLFFYF